MFNRIQQHFTVRDIDVQMPPAFYLVLHDGNSRPAGRQLFRFSAPHLLFPSAAGTIE